MEYTCKGLLMWIIRNLLTESQLDVVPPGCRRELRHMQGDVLQDLAR